MIPQPLQFVRVIWLDSLQPNPTWQWIDKVPVRKPAVNRTVGGVVRADDEQLTLAMSLSDPDEDGDRQVNGVMVIPAQCIRTLSIVDLE